MKIFLKQIGNSIVALIIFSFSSYSQKNDLECDFKMEKVGEGKYQVKIDHFDSLSHTESCFLSWMNTGKDKPDGELTVFDEKGNKRRLSVYKSGIRVGNHYYWYETGELECEYFWETDMYFTSKCYYKTGKVKHTATNGNRENAIYTSYYENGQVESENVWSADIDKTYYENGQIKTSKTKSTYTEWYMNGQIKLTGSLDVGGFTRIGAWVYYDETGKKTRELTYEKNNGGWYAVETGYKTEKKY